MDEPRSHSDLEIIGLIRSHEEQGWSLFLERYTAGMFGRFRHWGLEHHEAGDCFVTLCQSLVEEDFRALMAAPEPPPGGDLLGWLRGLARSTALDWARSTAGKAKIQAALGELPDSQRRISELYFQQGMTPPQIRSYLQQEKQQEILLVDVLERLETVLEKLSADRLWRLLSQLARQHGREEEEPLTDESQSALAEPSGGEQSKEFKRLWQAWAALDSRTALILQLRYDDCQSISQIALITGVSEAQALGSIRHGLLRLRRSLTPDQRT